MALTEYRRRRSFGKTPEPQGASQPRGGKKGLIFVVQKHAASHLHYDFRLELDGVLKSWAVPKGPSLHPANKSLAVQVEDHPYDYAKFEGTIPRGQYGGGTVMVWDLGTWEPAPGVDPHEGLRDGKLKFILHGSKLRGSWTLARMRPRGSESKPQWLLMKSGDAEAVRGPADDPRSQEARSVLTKRTMDEIAGSPRSKSWDSSRPGGRAAGSARGTSDNGHARAASAAGRKSRSPSRESPAGFDPASVPGVARAEFPESLEPQLATLTAQVPAGDEWIHEIKFDGYRILCFIEPGRTRLISRRGQDWTERFPHLAKAAAALPVSNAIIDGEAVVLNSKGVSDFQALQAALKGGRADIAYFAFDLPYADGCDLRGATLADRREQLRAVIPGEHPLIHFSEDIRGHGADVLKTACKLHLEGVICKRRNGVYTPGRSLDWRKVKCINRQEFVIGGYADSRKSRLGFGALLLGYYDDGRFTYAGRVGTGFSNLELKSVSSTLKKLEQDECPFDVLPRGPGAAGAHWVRPKLVAEIEFTEWTRDGRLRHPAFLGVREDKSASEVVRESARAAPRGASPAQESTEASLETESPPMKTKSKRSRVSGAAKSRGAGGPRPAARSPRSKPAPSANREPTVFGPVTITHPERVIYPAADVTKADMARYYDQISSWMLPHVRGRPMSLFRCPQGLGHACFFQKHYTHESPPGLHAIPIKEKEATRSYLVTDSPTGLLALVQINVVEVHLWGCTEDHLEQPDRLIFDLDPGDGVSWDQLVTAAVSIRDILAGVDLESFVKTSGGKGLHVIAPVRPSIGWDDLKEFARGIAVLLTQRNPSGYIAIMTKAKRAGRVFIDYLRNGRGATCVAPYSTRAREGATVSTPLIWKELEGLSKLPMFDLDAVLDRRGRLKTEPWADMLRTRQALSAKIRRALGVGAER